MITTESEELDRLTRCLRDHGASRSDMARHVDKASFLLAEYNHLGYNYRLTDIQAAVGCVQMERANWILDERRRRAHLYDEMLAGVDWLKIQATPPGYVHGYQAYVGLFCPVEPTMANVEFLHDRRNQLMMGLESKGIATRQGTHAPVIQGYYVEKYNLRPEQFPNSFMADRLSLTLPLYVQMTDDEQDQVVGEMRRVFEEL
jgi:dTDP-4-amino-4,6-dideoxygalactose transaminase